MAHMPWVQPRVPSGPIVLPAKSSVGSQYEGVLFPQPILPFANDYMSYPQMPEGGSAASTPYQDFTGHLASPIFLEEDTEIGILDFLDEEIEDDPAVPPASSAPAATDASGNKFPPPQVPMDIDFDIDSDTVGEGAPHPDLPPNVTLDVPPPPTVNISESEKSIVSLLQSSNSTTENNSTSNTSAKNGSLNNTSTNHSSVNTTLHKLLYPKNLTFSDPPKLRKIEKFDSAKLPAAPKGVPSQPLPVIEPDLSTPAL